MPKKLFQPGKSGNPKGRPKGPSKSAIIRDKLINALEAEAVDVIKSVILKAKKGDMVAAKIILDRLIPSQKAIEGAQGDRKPMINIIVNRVEDTRAIEAQAEIIENKGEE